MAIRKEEVIPLGVRQIDALLLEEHYEGARRLADELLARHGHESALLKAAGYAALLDEQGDGFLKTVEFFEMARQADPDDLEALFWAGWTARACGVSDADIERGAVLLSDLAQRDVESRYVAYACASHPTREKDRAAYDAWVERGLTIVPNLASLWEARIGHASSPDRQRELFDEFKTLAPFHDYTEMRAMDVYVASVIARDYWVPRWTTLEDLLLMRPSPADDE